MPACVPSACRNASPQILLAPYQLRAASGCDSSIVVVRVAVYARGGREDDLLHTRVAGRLEHVERADDIDVEAPARIVSAGVERQHRGVEEPVDTVEHLGQALAVTDVAGLEADPAARERVGEMRLAWIEVEHDNLGGTRRQEPVDDVGADEAGTAGDEEPVTWDLHAGASWRGTWTDARARRTPSAPPRASAHASKGAYRTGAQWLPGNRRRPRPPRAEDRASARRMPGPGGRPPAIRRDALRAMRVARRGCSRASRR